MSELKEELNLFQEQNKELDLKDFSKDLDDSFPQTKILNDYFIRVKLSKIESHLEVIKTVIVIFVVLSILGAIMIVLSSVGI